MLSFHNGKPMNMDIVMAYTGRLSPHMDTAESIYKTADTREAITALLREAELAQAMPGTSAQDTVALGYVLGTLRRLLA